jgi:hypothetical protein
VTSPLRDPKSLPQWAELDYYRRPRRLRRLRRAATWLAAAAGIAVLAVALWPASRWAHPAGPLSQAHAMLANDCRQCHQEFLRPAQRFLEADTALRSVSDSACRRCHDGPVHQEQQANTPACAGCHREHRGRIQLTQMADVHCTSCHADLPASMKEPAACRFGNVTRFDVDHPEFKLWRGGPPTDPGTVAFNHRVHHGLTGMPGRGTDNLSCSSCHVLDAEGHYFQPIRYNAHCARCHPLSVQVTAETRDPEVARAALQFGAEPAPHDRPVVVRAVLGDRYARFARDFPAVCRAAAPVERPIPGRPDRRPAAGDASAWVAVQRNQAEHQLFDLAGGCRFCHRLEGGHRAGELPVYALSNLADRWLPASRFRHESHQVLSCGECHSDAADSASAADVLLPRVATCQQCHNPRVGARSDCVECHRYHDRAKGRGPEGLQTIGEYLGGAGN